MHRLSMRFKPHDKIGVQWRAPIEPLDIYVPWCSKGFRGLLIGQLWSRETTVSRKAVRLIVAYFLFCWVEFLSTEKWFSFSCWIRFHLKLLTIYGMQLNQIPFGSKTNGGWMYTSTVLFKREYPSVKFRLY